MLTNEEIKNFAGHEEFGTTERYYEFSTQSLPNRADAFEKALSKSLKRKSVTNCNHST